MKNLTALLMLAAFSFCVYAETKTEQDIPYSRNSDSYSKERCKLDIQYPTDTTGVPVIVWFHGGGLTGGNKKIPKELRCTDYVVIAPNYRLMPNVGIDGCIDDAAAAVAWTFENAEKYGGDKSKIFVAGHSAGGYLSSMIGFERKWLDKYGVASDSIAGLVPFSGQAITHFAQRKTNGQSELQPGIDEYAPIYHIRKDTPPYIIITGDAELELFGRYEENLYLWRMLKLAGHEDVKIYKLDGYNHGNMTHPAFHILKQEVKRILRNR